jgi:hypothetical protein
MKRLLSTVIIGLMAFTSAFGIITQKTNTVNLVLANVCDGSFTDFRTQISGYDDQVFKFNYDTSLTGVSCTFRITKPKDGTIYLDVAAASITVSGTSVTFSIAQSNIPPAGSYYGELLSYDENPVYRSIAQGTLPVTWSLYNNELSFFNRATTNAAVGQVYMHPNWIFPPWLTTNDVPGSIYVTLTTYNANNVLQANTNAGFQLLHNAQVTTNLSVAARLTAEEALSAAQVTTNAAFSVLHAAQTATNAAFEPRIQEGETAYGWGDHASAGYLSATQSIYSALTIADRSQLATNIAGLTQGTYTGSLTSVSYTGVTAMVVGRTYLMGYTKVGASGTSTLSIASQSLIKTAAGATSNFFTYAGTDTNLVLKLDGDGLSICNVSGVYVQQITNGNMNVAGDVSVGGTIYVGGAAYVNPTAHIAATGTNVHGLNTMATNLATDFVRGDNATYTDTVAKAGSALQSESDPIHTNWLATNTYVKVETDPIHTNWLATNTYLKSNPGWATNTDLTAHTTNTDNPHAVTAAQAGAVATNDAKYLAALTNGAPGTSTNLNDYNNDAGFLTTSPGVTTNQIMDAFGVLYTITNVSDTADDTLHFDAYTASGRFAPSLALGTTAGTAFDGGQGVVIGNIAQAALDNNVLTSNAIPTNASEINVAHAPVNYAASTPDVESHIVGIDAAFGGLYLTVTNLVVAGAVEPNVNGTYTPVLDYNGYPAWSSTNGYFSLKGYDVDSREIINTNAVFAKWYAGAGNYSPTGTYNPLANATGTLTITYFVFNPAYNIYPTNAYRGDWGALSSNLAYTASTNAEAARVIATNAQAVANAALPASSEPWTTNRYVADAPGSTFTNLLIWVGSTNNQTSTNDGTLYFTW